MESLPFGVASHFQALLLFSMRTESLASSQSCCSAETWCKWTLRCVQAALKSWSMYNVIKIQQSIDWFWETCPSHFFIFMEFLKLGRTIACAPFVHPLLGNPGATAMYLHLWEYSLLVKYVQIFLCWISFVDRSRSHLLGLHGVRPTEGEWDGGVYGGRKRGILQQSTGRPPAEPHGDVLRAKRLHTHSNPRQNIHRYVFAYRNYRFFTKEI